MNIVKYDPITGSKWDITFSTNKAILNDVHATSGIIKDKNDLILPGKTFEEFHKFKYILL